MLNTWAGRFIKITQNANSLKTLFCFVPVGICQPSRQKQWAVGHTLDLKRGYQSAVSDPGVKPQSNHWNALKSICFRWSCHEKVEKTSRDITKALRRDVFFNLFMTAPSKTSTFDSISLAELWDALGELWEGLEELGAQYFSKNVKNRLTNSLIGPRSTIFL